MALIVKESDKEKESEEETIGTPHLAITDMDLSGGAANGRNISLLMKNGVELSEEHKAILSNLLKSSPVDEGKINKEDETMTQEIIKANAEIEVLKAQLEKSAEDVKRVMEEINKAKADVEKANKDREDALNALDELKKEAADKKLNERLEIIKMFVKEEEQYTSLHKAIGALEDEGFDAVINVLKNKDKAVDESYLTKQMSNNNASDKENQDNDILGEILRSKYGAK